MTAASPTGSYIVVSNATKCLIQKTSCRSANSNFCASGTHVLKCTLRSGSRNRYFRQGLQLFDSNTHQIYKGMKP